MKSIAPVLQIVEQAQSFGFRHLESGAKLYGHIPHVAPEAWLHQVYAPLSEQALMATQQQLGQDLPNALCQFFQAANGLGLFAYSMATYGRPPGTLAPAMRFGSPFVLSLPTQSSGPTTLGRRKRSSVPIVMMARCC